MKVLKPDTAVMTGVAEAALVLAIYTHNMPSAANVRSNPQPNDKNLEAARKSAAFQSAGLLGLVFLLTRDWNSFLIGGGMLAGIDIWIKHHNAVEPASGKTSMATDGAVQPQAMAVYGPVSGMSAAPDSDGSEWAS